MATRFLNRVVAITGGSGGMGIATAQRLCREGAKVALLDVNQSKLDEVSAALKGFHVETYVCDISDENSVNKTFASIESAFGKLDGLINTAGITGKTGVKCDGVDLDDFRRVMEVNIHGTFLTNKAAIQLFLKNGGYGRICNVASIAGKEGNPGMCAYSASKAAVIGLTKSLGKEYAETNITVNAMAPAVIRTPILDDIPQSTIDYMTSKIPMQRCGTLDEVASILTYIISEENSFTTGFCYDLTGGRATY